MNYYIKEQLKLPSELIARIEPISDHAALEQQLNSLSTEYPHPGGGYRWHSQLGVLPYFHIIDTRENGKIIILHLLVNPPGRILTLSCIGGEWTCVSIRPSSDVRRVIPGRYSLDNRRWFLKPASQRQIARLKKILAGPLPQLTSFNASLLIKTHLLLSDLPAGRWMIDLWVAEAGGEVREPLLPFPGLH